jgi:hypothetical protein
MSGDIYQNSAKAVSSAKEQVVNATTQRFCAWSGLVMIVLWLFGFWVFAGFIPIPSPQTTPEAITDYYSAHTNSIRLGLIFTATGSAFLAPFIAVISVQIRRIEGRNTPLAYTQLALGAILVLEFIYPVFIMQGISFRRDRPAGVVLAMYDVAWLLFIGVVSTAILQMLVIGIAILSDRRPEPILPRWLGYLSLWVSISFCPGSAIVFFKNGPVAWNGLFSWWMPVIAFAIWIAAMTAMLLKAVAREEAGESDSSGFDGDPATQELRTEVKMLSDKVASLLQDRRPPVDEHVE